MNTQESQLIEQNNERKLERKLDYIRQVTACVYLGLPALFCFSIIPIMTGYLYLTDIRYVHLEKCVAIATYVPETDITYYNGIEMWESGSNNRYHYSCNHTFDTASVNGIGTTEKFNNYKNFVEDECAGDLGRKISVSKTHGCRKHENGTDDLKSFFIATICLAGYLYITYIILVTFCIRSIIYINNNHPEINITEIIRQGVAESTSHRLTIERKQREQQQNSNIESQAKSQVQNYAETGLSTTSNTVTQSAPSAPPLSHNNDISFIQQEYYPLADDILVCIKADVV